MCDTILASPPSTAQRRMLFGKNSDRQRNEAQAVEYLPGSEHPAGARVVCTYIAIPQLQRTHAVLLCRPFWTWGAEMGANEHGVVVGNQGLHARTGPPQAPALIGMDLVRLALERSRSAAEGIEVITSLLELHGQGGDCGHLMPSYYHNGFMVADATEAFVLETVGREWLLERVSGVRAISNRYSIEHKVERASAGIPALMQDLGAQGQPWRGYAELLADPQRHAGHAARRRACSSSLLKSREGQLRVADMMAILRDHGCADGPSSDWTEECPMQRTVCMHAGSDPGHGQTVGSMVSELHEHSVVHWVTGTAAPCISVFKPVLMDVPLPEHGRDLSDRFDARTLWWRHEVLHRSVLCGDFGSFLQSIRPERDALEGEFHALIDEVIAAGSAEERARAVAECWDKAIALEQAWQGRLGAVTPLADNPYLSCWRDMNLRADLGEAGA